MKYAENLEGIFNLHAQNMAITEKMAEYTFGSTSNELSLEEMIELSLEEMIENITSDLKDIAVYISGEDSSLITPITDDEESARFMLGVLVTLTQFMVETTDPAILRSLLHERVMSNAKDFLKMARHDGIDTIEDSENIAYAYKVLGERAAYEMMQNLHSTSPTYFDTDTVCNGSDKHKHCYIVMQERGFGKKYFNMQMAIRKIKDALHSDKCMANTLADISSIISLLDGIDTTEGGEE